MRRIFRCSAAATPRSASRRSAGASNWCCDCPKCRFVFLALAPFVDRQRLIATFGRDMLDDPAQIDGFAELCGLQRHKPFECVGEIEESATVMAHLAGMADWRDDAVVRALAPRLQAATSPRCSRCAGRIWFPSDTWRCSMRVDELRGRRIAIWGFAREGRAALRFLRERDPGMAITVLDDADGARDVDAPLISGRAAIAAAIGGFDVVVKSPGISLYDPLVLQARANGVRFTSLLNLWFADAPTCRTICVTGTKGKSTTTALIAHILRGVGWNAVAAGNIGVPVTELPRDGLDAAVIEVSSYQAADFDGQCDIAVLTSLHQEHLDWHGSVAAYRRDKLNLLRHARHSLINRDAVAAVGEVLDLDRLDHGDVCRVSRRCAWATAISRARTTCPTWRARWRWRGLLGVDAGCGAARGGGFSAAAASSAGDRRGGRRAVCRRQHLDHAGGDDCGARRVSRPGGHGDHRRP